MHTHSFQVPGACSFTCWCEALLSCWVDCHLPSCPLGGSTTFSMLPRHGNHVVLSHVATSSAVSSSLISPPAGLYLPTLPPVSDPVNFVFSKSFFPPSQLCLSQPFLEKRHFTTLGSASEARKIGEAQLVNCFTISEAPQLPSFLVSGPLCSLKSYYRPQRASACVRYTY